MGDAAFEEDYVLASVSWIAKKKIPVLLIVEDNNFDSASLQLKKVEGCFQINFWDGYSQSEVVEVFSERDATKTLKRFMRKLLKILNR